MHRNINQHVESRIVYSYRFFCLVTADEIKLSGCKSVNALSPNIIMALFFKAQQGVFVSHMPRVVVVHLVIHVRENR